MKIRETIHHGDYHNVRTIDVPEPKYSHRTYAANLTFAGLISVLGSSPYAAGKKTVDDHADNEFVAQLFVDLLTKGHGEFGWARYEVVS